MSLATWWTAGGFDADLGQQIEMFIEPKKWRISAAGFYSDTNLLLHGAVTQMIDTSYLNVN